MTAYSLLKNPIHVVSSNGTLNMNAAALLKRIQKRQKYIEKLSKKLLRLEPDSSN